MRRMGLELVELSGVSGLDFVLFDWLKKGWEKTKSFFSKENEEKKKKLAEELQKLKAERERIKRIFEKFGLKIPEKYERKYLELESKFKKLIGIEGIELGAIPLIIGGVAIGTAGLLAGWLGRGLWDNAFGSIKKLKQEYSNLYNAILNDPNISPELKTQILSSASIPSPSGSGFLGNLNWMIAIIFALIFIFMAWKVFQEIRK